MPSFNSSVDYIIIHRRPLGVVFLSLWSPNLNSAAYVDFSHWVETITIWSKRLINNFVDSVFIPRMLIG